MRSPEPGERAGDRPVPRPASAPARRRALRLWAPVVATLVVQVPPYLGTLLAPRWVFRGGPGRRAPFSLDLDQALALLAITLLAAAALVAARRAPGPVVAVVAGLAVADALVAGDDRFWPPFVALAFAIVAAVVHGARVWAWISVAVLGLLLLVVAPMLGVDLPTPLLAAGTVAAVVAFGAGEAVRGRRERAAADALARETAQRDALQAERVRIARELHDVLAHSLSQISLQAGVGLHLSERDPEKAREALASVRDTSKTALEEVRHVLGVLRSDDAEAPLVPEPDLSRLDALVASFRAQGIDVRLDTSLGPGVPRPVQLALYRIVQESLTNVARHSGAASAEVVLAERDGAWIATVSDDGRGGAAGGDGRGILGMHERAALLGGTLSAGPRPGGGFAVEARIPIRRENP
ncbi:sensor histidine kinase [Herbiconiux sp. SYSU D00978]|uniref:sensor histidine kinase n=1 Tax=Herbiconiux sp. SYSU D00978 TaxID=2812562 RepID=UPI001A960E4A|nr:histidine kinase [Herbiconiux sp. SYSU D00978]